MSIAIIYIDDVVVPGRTFMQAADGLEKVLYWLQENCLKVKTKKCHLFQKEVYVLGTYGQQTRQKAITGTRSKN